MSRHRLFMGLIGTAVITLAAGVAATGSALADGRLLTAGWTEKIRIKPSGLDLLAKLDTGADNSSLNASEIRIFKRGGERWVSFRVKNRNGKSVVFERPVVRTARIKNLDGESLRRPTVMFGICLGSIFREVEVNLAERKGFKFNMLIGRSYMKDRLVVDSARTYLTEPKCPEIAAR